MPLSPLAGKPAPADLLIDVERLVSAYYTRKPDSGDPQQLVSFGMSGHRGTAENATDRGPDIGSFLTQGMSDMNILLLNASSSSLKCTLMDSARCSGN
jgi:hypothetical protein